MDIGQAMDRIIAEAQAVKASLPVQSERLVRAGEPLQPALDAGGTVRLEAGATWDEAGGFTIRRPTTLLGEGATLIGRSAPCLSVQPGTFGVTVDGPEVRSGHPDLVLVGENTDRQTTVEAAPAVVVLRRMKVSGHDGKRAFYINARDVVIEDVEAVDIWSHGGQDSQAVCISNAPGPVVVRRNRLSAGSELVLSGGDRTKIPNLVPRGIVIEDNDLFRPAGWQTDGVERKVKNFVEFKNGEDVAVRRNRMRGCWKDGQDGYAIVLTPALDGAAPPPLYQSGRVRNVLIEDNDVRDCSSFLQLLGYAYQSYTDAPVSGLVVRRNVIVCSRAQYGGFGQLMRAGAEPTDVTFERNLFIGDGSSTLYYYRGSVMQPDGTKRPGGNIARLVVRQNLMTLGDYGFNLDGTANAGTWPAVVGEMPVIGNQFGGPTTMRRHFEENVYGTRDALLADSVVLDALARGPIALAA